MKNTSNTPKKASKKANVSITPSINKTPDTVAYWLDEARNHLSNDNLESAIEAYQHATRIDPDCEFWVEMGEHYLNDRQYEQALIAYEQANKLDPSNAFRASYWEWLGRTREALQDYNGALEAYSKWARVAPESIAPIDRSGALMVLQEQWTDLPVLRNQYLERSRYKTGNASDLDPEVLESMALYAYFLEKELGSTEDPSAQELAYATLRDKYNSIAMRYLLGCIYFDMERWDSADTEFMRALNLMESDPEWCEYRFNLNWSAKTATFMRAKIAYRQHNYKEALLLLKNIVYVEDDKNGLELIYPSKEKINIEDIKIYHELIRILLDMGLIDSANKITDQLCQIADVPQCNQSLLNNLYEILDESSKDENLEVTLDDPKLLTEIYFGKIIDKITPWRHQFRLECSMRTGDYSKAQNALESIHALHQEEEYTLAKDDISVSISNASSKHLLTAKVALENNEKEKAISSLRRYCKAYPNDDQRIAQLVELIRETLPLPHFEKELEKLLRKFPQSISLLEYAQSYYTQHGKRTLAKLIHVNLNAIKAESYHPKLCEWLCPSAPDNPCLLLAVSARAIPGSGQILVTGGNETVANYAQIAHSYMLAESKSLELTDLDSIDLHINLRPLGRKEISLSEFNQLQKREEQGNSDFTEDLSNCDEHIGLALFLAMYSAIRHELPKKLTLVGGSIDLYGNVGAMPSFGNSLNYLAQYEGDCWERLIVPLQAAPVLMKNSASIWSDVDDIIIGTSISQIIDSMRN